MARKITFKEEEKQRFVFKGITRKENIRPKRKFFLIICDGEKTEPNYFKSLKDDLPKGVLNVYDFQIDGTGRSTTSLIKKAKEIREGWRKKNSSPVDKLWVVFDKDNYLDWKKKYQKCSIRAGKASENSRSGILIPA
jgi:hypothetical protein